MPPAVAHAPIVTRNFEARRMPWILSASCAVVIDPSTRERSYGPFTTAREASGKLAISTASATASNSSSQSKRLNWQPSHDENFQTASLGLRLAISDLRPTEQRRNTIKGKHRAVLAVTAQANAAFHVAFHGQVGTLRCHPALLQFHHGEAHHHLGTANERDSVGGIERGTRDHRRDHAHIATPSA